MNSLGTESGAACRIAICGEVYSPNLGDGVIAGGLTYLIREFLPSVRIDWVDLSGRGGWGGESSEERRFHPLASLRSTTLRRCGELVWMAGQMARMKVSDERQYALLVIGGGELLMDDCLSFPTKLLVQMHRFGPGSAAWALHACGVGDRFSWVGRGLLSQVLGGARRVSMSVRDEGARRNLRRHFPAMPEAGVVPDPGLWASEVYGPVRAEGSRKVGLGIMACPESGRGQQARVWVGLAKRLDGDGQSVELFTNGLPEDQAFAIEVWEQLPAAMRERVLLRPRPTTPGELVTTISSYGLVVAERLHAHVVAHSLGLPSVGIVREGKVREFGRLTGRSGFFVEAGQVTADRLADVVRQSGATPVDAGALAALKCAARSGVGRMLAKAGLVGGVA